VTDEQDISIALLQQRLAQLEDVVRTQASTLQELRDDRIRIEGGRWVLWFLGGLIMAALTVWYNIVNSTPLQRILGVHGG